MRRFFRCGNRDHRIARVPERREIHAHNPIPDRMIDESRHGALAGVTPSGVTTARQKPDGGMSHGDADDVAERCQRQNPGGSADRFGRAALEGDAAG